MRFFCRVLRVGLGALACLALAGCFPFSGTDQDEKNPLIGDGLAKKAAYNFQGAVESFEKALEGNPRLARAHWELALLYSQNVPNPAAAIYHFERLLKLRPDWPQADAARRLTDAAKIELAKSVPLGPQTPYMQQQLDKLTAQVHDMANENNRLRQQNQTLLVQIQQLNIENTHLKDQLQALQAPAPPGTTPPAGSPPPQTPGAGRLAPGTVATTQTPSASLPNVDGRVANPPGLTRSAQPSPSSPTPAPKPATHTVRRGENMTRIAAAHGLKLRDLIRANPSVNPHRLKVGQVLTLP